MLVLLGGQKGGTGKSTQAVNLAVMRTKRERDTLLYDSDDQKTSTLWAARRIENNIEPAIQSMQKILDDRVVNPGIVIRKELKSLIPRYQDIIIDAGGVNNDVLRAAMTMADIFIIPVMTSAFDTWTLETINNLVSEVRQTNPNLVAKVLYNKVTPHPITAKTEIEESDDMLKDFDQLERFKSFITYRVSIRRSQSRGLSVAEYKPYDEKAIEEVSALYEEVFNGH